jgi:uncharacterized membrane protein YkoI
MQRTHRLLLSVLAGGSLLAGGLAFASSDGEDRDDPLPTDALSLRAIAAQLEEEDYQVLAIEPDDRRYEVEVLDADGQLWEMELDPRTGKVLDREREDREDWRERSGSYDQKGDRGDRSGRGEGDRRGDRDDRGERRGERSERGEGRPGSQGPRSAGMPASEILAEMEALGYEVVAIERERGVYDLEMRDANGFEVEAYLDVYTGEVLR